MANITIPIADANIGELRDALCEYGDRQAQVPDPTAGLPGGSPAGTMIPNPIGKAAFAADVLKGIARDILKDYRKAQAAKAAAATPNLADL
jgi:hypothetical protein